MRRIPYRRLALLLLIALAVTLPARGDEGQWPPDRLGDLDWKDLQRRGLSLSPEEIWNGEGTGLAMAVARLNGCTAAFISEDGLLVTNHHCAFRAIQHNSTPEDNILENGFLARRWAEERRAPGYRAEVLRDFSEVTDRVKAAVTPEMSDRDRYLALERARKEIVAECEERAAVRCRVGSEFGGLRYVLFESLELKDVRLVYAPPDAIGEYGGEVDNWMWPRHTGDFALMRAYVSPEGESAEPADENMPFEPVRHLELSQRGVRPGDLVMLMGYPGRTDRYLPSAAIASRLALYYPRRLVFYAAWQELLLAAGERSEAAHLAVAGSAKGVANGLKNSRGMVAGLKRNEVLERKLAEEELLAAWIAEEESRVAEFGGLLEELNALYREEAGLQEKELLLKLLPRASKTFGFAHKVLLNAREREKDDLDRKAGYQERDQTRLRVSLERAQKDLDPGAERAVTTYFLTRLLELPARFRVDARDGVVRLVSSEDTPQEHLGTDRTMTDTGGAVEGPGDATSEAGAAAADSDATGAATAAPGPDIAAFVSALYSTTRLGDLETRMTMLEKPRVELEESTDSMLRLALALEPEYDAMDEREESRKGALSRLLPGYSRLLMERRGRVYPDADGTLRISVARVRGYSPADAVWMDPQTTLGGLLEKATGEFPFAVPPRVREAATGIDPERWSQPSLEDVPVCFLADADTTGGNSGSPVLDGQGRLVGLNFDRVFENIAGDYGYMPAVARNVSVDIRFFLWMLEKVEEAYPVLREIGVKPSPPKPRDGNARK